MPRALRSYSDQQIGQALAVLDVCKGSVSEASRKTGVPRKTLERWSKRKTKRLSSPETAADLATAGQLEKGNLADAFERVAWKCVTRLTDSDIVEKCSRPSELSTVAGTAVDKMRLLRGQAPPGADFEATKALIERAVASLVTLTAKTKKPLTAEQAFERIKQVQLSSTAIQ